MIKFRSLIQRNILFAATRLRFKILAFFGILSGTDFFAILSGTYSTFYKSIFGITQTEFKQSFGLIPYSWLYILFGILIIFNDDIIYDLYSISANLIIKLKRRSMFVIGKMMTEILFIIVFHLLLILEKMVFIIALHDANELPSAMQIIYFGILNLFASIFLCLMFHFFVLLFKNTIFSFILCLFVIVIGLPFRSHLFPIQFMMLSRTHLVPGIVYCLVGSIILFCINILLFHNIDLLETREKYEK